MSSHEHGYDVEFVDAPPAYLKCAICHFVLRDPVQVLACGHEFCICCFDRLRGYSSESASDLFCPLDGKVIDYTKVVKDRFSERIIADLHVYCSFKEQGCNWHGELRNAEVHNLECFHALKGKPVEELQYSGGGGGGTIPAEVMKQIFSRLEKCEEALIKKDKDIAHLKFSLKETNEKLEKSEEEKRKILLEGETCKTHAGRLEALIKEVDVLKTMMLQKEFEYKQEVGQLCVQMNSVDRTVVNEVKKLSEEVEELKNEIRNRPIQSDDIGKRNLNNDSEGSGANVSSNLTQSVNNSMEKNIFEWDIPLLEFKPGVLTYSSVFYCRTNGFPGKLAVYIHPDDRTKFFFVPDDLSNFPDETIFNIELDVLGFSRYENLCRKQISYKQNVKKYLLLHTMDKDDCKRYITSGYYFGVKYTWSYEEKQVNK